MLTISRCFDRVPGNLPILDQCRKLVEPKRLIFMLAFQTYFVVEEIISTWGNPRSQEKKPIYHPCFAHSQ